MCCEHCRPKPEPMRQGGMIYRSADCTCGAWSSILPPPPCPVHGQAHAFRVTC